MDIKKIKNDAVDKFLEELYKNNRSEVVCPICMTKLIIDGDISTSFTVKCQTENCLSETFRGI